MWKPIILEPSLTTFPVSLIPLQKVLNYRLVAQTFNPSIFRETWLVDNGVVSKDEIPDQLLMMPQVVSFENDSFSFLVLPDRLQIKPKSLDAEDQAKQVLRVAKIARLLPQTPYIALGLNFIWRGTPEHEPFGEFSRRIFQQPKNPLFAMFADNDARFGSYFSKQVEAARMKVDLKPLAAESPQGRSEHLQLSFNFHHELRGLADAAERISDAIGAWCVYSQTAEQMARSIEEEERL